MATLTEDPGTASLFVFDPEGHLSPAAVTRRPGPPFTLWSTIDEPKAGRWTALVADGTHIVACERIVVSRFSPKADEATEEPSPRPAWESHWKWERDTHNLYAAFVAELFNYPLNEEVSWTNLQTVLQDPARNLLHNHLGLDEDTAITMGPDCADLPYFLRAYFAWKTTLPFGLRRCSRGRAGTPPACGDLITNLSEVNATDDVDAFQRFTRVIASGVHSASARTVPDDSKTDVYPVAMTREAILPGTVYADPYGHLLVVAQWIPQGTKDYGVLVGVDAQPDGTIGRRRFWRGSFLFSPDTADVGAGFKAWRPLTWDPETETLVSLDNEALQTTKEHARFSRAQYEGTKD
ncbi:MAG: hypothetical protein KC416_17225, partial [Myxococcales bacterium]|nr:hypothetical protein [Myxococcales bacterium]